MKTNNFFLIAGPCVIESKELLQETASELKKICLELDIELYFKSSYRKANRTSSSTFSGLGDETALQYLKEIKDEFGLPLLTDVHTADEAIFAANYVDALQIPAFLCRQTDLIQAAAKTGKIVNIKKGQFLNPEAMKGAVEKAKSVGGEKIWLTERGTFFGYNDLVVDFRSLLIMKEFGCPVVYDATHSVQKPSQGLTSGGAPEFIPALAKAAVAVGIDGLFIETHPNPKEAKSDAGTQLPLKDMKKLLESLLSIHRHK